MNYRFEVLRDKKRWNDFLLSLPKDRDGVDTFSFTSSFEWIAFQESLGQETYPFCIKDQQDQIVGVGGGIIIRAKRGRYLYFRNGPVLDWTDKELVQKTIAHLKRVTKQKGLWFFRVSPLIRKESLEATNLKNSARNFNFPMNDVEALDTYVMNISKDEEELFAEIKKKTRYEIRKAEKECEVFITNDEKYIDDFYKIEEDTVKRNNWNAYPKEFILKEFRAFSKSDNASIILIKHQDKFIAGGMFIHFGSQTFYHYGGALTEYRNIPSAYLYIWEAIKLAKARNHSHFNFWGITPAAAKADHPWTGLTKFKMKFPGSIFRWNTAKDFPVDPRYLLTNLFERFDKLRKGY